MTKKLSLFNFDAENNQLFENESNKIKDIRLNLEKKKRKTMKRRFLYEFIQQVRIEACQLFEIIDLSSDRYKFR